MIGLPMPLGFGLGGCLLLERHGRAHVKFAIANPGPWLVGGAAPRARAPRRERARARTGRLRVDARLPRLPRLLRPPPSRARPRAAPRCPPQSAFLAPAAAAPTPRQNWSSERHWRPHATSRFAWHVMLTVSSDRAHAGRSSTLIERRRQAEGRAVIAHVTRAVRSRRRRSFNPSAIHPPRVPRQRTQRQGPTRPRGTPQQTPSRAPHANGSIGSIDAPRLVRERALASYRVEEDERRVEREPRDQRGAPVHAAAARERARPAAEQRDRHDVHGRRRLRHAGEEDVRRRPLRRRERKTHPSHTRRRATDGGGRTRGADG